jgi:hypothetical protein
MTAHDEPAAQQSEPSPAEITPTSVQPPEPPEFARHEGIPKGVNWRDVIGYAIGSPGRTRNLERIIWTMTGLLALAIGTVSAVGYLVFHYHAAGSIGIATALVAGIGRPLAAIRRWLGRRRVRKD